jgi:hypothetical protein
MQDRKSRNPQLSKLINDLEKEYTAIHKDSPSYILVDNKIKKFYQFVDEKTTAKCHKELNELQSYTKIEKEALLPIKGKEDQAKVAIDNFNSCQGDIGQYVLALGQFSEYNTSIVSGSLELCIDDCEKNINELGSAEMRSCVKNCFNFTFNYSIKNVENLLKLQIDASLEELKKI